MPDSERVVLPTSVRPIRYRLALEPDLEEFTFKGSESIDVEVVEPTSEVALNCVEIDVLSCSLTGPDGEATAPIETVLDEAVETVTFRFDSPVPAGEARLDIEFTGELNDKLRGFYRSHYTDADGVQRYMATTQFEPTDARRAFPCWDEPAVKATFEVTLELPSDLVAVSNMPVSDEAEPRPGMKRVSFEETPVMSTYLLAFVIGDLAAIEQEADGGTIVRIWATRGKEEQGRFALDTSVRLLAYMNDYFGIPYPLPKLDHLAVPDFAAGAMENWGAITYRETALLVDPENSSAGTRQIVAAIVAHEMAHMWFGDLVTMAWWNDLWLNESFASWMGDKAVDSLFPEWEMWTQFLTADTSRALSLDGLKSSHPIEQEVGNPSEIGQLFDAISYSKGASIIRMLDDFLGEDVFRRGLREYLRQHEYANARTSDLWDALGEASGRPVTAIMETWVAQTGYPVIDVAVDRRDDEIDLTFAQSRFTYEHILGGKSRDRTVWRVPVSARTASDAEPVSVLMEDAEAEARVRPAPYGSTSEWIKINPMQTGFYRVRYPDEELALLRAPIENRVLPPADRLGIQNDAFALARAGHVPATDFLSIARAYSNETDASVCSDLAANLGTVDTLLWNEPSYPAFQRFARDVFRPIGERIGWEPRRKERHLDVLLRSTVLHTLGGAGDEATLTEASERFERYARDPSSVRADIRGVVSSLAAQRGDRSTYDRMWEMREESPLQEEKGRLLVAACRFEQPDIIRETLDRSLSDRVRIHETINVIAAVASTRHGRDMAWEFLKGSWDELDRRYGEGGFGLMRLVSIVSGFTSEEQREDVERFFTDHPVPSADRTVRQALERIRLNAAWLDRNRAELSAWLAPALDEE